MRYFLNNDLRFLKIKKIKSNIRLLKTKDQVLLKNSMIFSPPKLHFSYNRKIGRPLYRKQIQNTQSYIKAIFELKLQLIWKIRF